MSRSSAPITPTDCSWTPWCSPTTCPSSCSARSSTNENIQVSEWWTLALLPALTVVLFGGLHLLYEVKEDWARLPADVLQVAFAWLMCFGLIGLFRLIAARERFWVRYLSDASYWLYLWHLPLIVAVFELLALWRIDIHLKFALMCVSVTAILLVVYQFGVRYTPIGTMLNGKRTRQTAAQRLGAADSRNVVRLSVGGIPNRSRLQLHVPQVHSL